MNNIIQVKNECFDEPYCEISNICKQLQEKEQELKRLKKAIKLYNCIEKWGTKECHCACRCLGNEFCDDADKKINQLKADNEYLKNFHINLVGVKECEIRELLQLKKTLAEIKRLAEIRKNDRDWLTNKILQKISECEVEK